MERGVVKYAAETEGPIQNTLHLAWLLYAAAGPQLAGR